MTRTRAEEYRRLGQDCLALAKAASSEEGGAVLIEGAEMWFRLAKEQDAESADIQAPVLRSPIEDQRVAQQQQQVQPEDDKKE